MCRQDWGAKVFYSWWYPYLLAAMIVLSIYFFFKASVSRPAKTKEVKTMIYDYGKRQDTVKVTTTYEVK